MHKKNTSKDCDSRDNNNNNNNNLPLDFWLVRSTKMTTTSLTLLRFVWVEFFLLTLWARSLTIMILKEKNKVFTLTYRNNVACISIQTFQKVKRGSLTLRPNVVVAFSGE